MSTNLREADAIVTAEGVLQEKTLKVEYVDGIPSISGNIVLKVSDTNTITFSTKMSSKTKKGEDNKVYAGLVTVMNEYKSIADVGEENADRISIDRGQMRPAYMVKSGREGIFYQANFFNRISAGETITPHADFEIEVYIDSVVPEQYASGDKQGEETGRAVVHAWLPTYNGIEPIDLIAPKDIAEAVMDQYSKGMTVKFFGDIVNSRVEKKSVTQVKIGKPKETTSITYTNELIITGATDAYEDEAKIFDKEAVQLAKQEREARIAEKKAQASSSSSSSNSWQQKSAAPDAGRKLPF